jgi:hypothetical protein
LGERFSYFRMPSASPEDDFMACVVADENAGHQRDVRSNRAREVRRFFDALVLPDALPPLLQETQDRLISLANLGARCRSSVVRDGYSREIDLVPDHERSPRLYGQLRQLHAGLVVIGTPSALLWQLLAKVALDGVHPGRRAVIEYLVANPDAHTTATIAAHCRLTKTPARRHLEDLMAHRVVDLVGEAPERWRASEWLVERWQVVEANETPGGPS